MKKTTFFSTLILLILIACSARTQTAGNHQPSVKITDDSLLNLVEYQTFQYFWKGAEPNSGMACERIHMDGVYPENDQHIVTTGGSGFGFMAIIAGIERNYISREQGLTRFEQIVSFLEKADRFHGAWPHWLDGETGKVKPFGTKDNGADLVETSYLLQGLLTVRQYFINGDSREQELANRIDKLWTGVEYDWFTRGKDVIYWHWSPDYGWEMNFPVEGYNECLILYILGASSPTHAVPPSAYHNGWARNGAINGLTSKYGYTLHLKHNGALEYGGPLFWAHYSYLGLDPRGLKDNYANYWDENKNQTLINRQWCIENPKKFKGYSKDCWGLTASYSINGYAAHAPGKDNDLGVISPTAAISSIPYTPEYSLEAIRYFYSTLRGKIWGNYGFYDAFSIQNNWYPTQYLAIDQGPAAVMIENYRSGLLWKLFMSCPEIQKGLQKLGFQSPSIIN
ncbi:MAG: beta-glucosidase [Bacteroidetes bacterium]|nr:beta-glucosidase [Bacteroidota bacterium]